VLALQCLQVLLQLDIPLFRSIPQPIKSHHPGVGHVGAHKDKGLEECGHGAALLVVDTWFSEVISNLEEQILELLVN